MADREPGIYLIGRPLDHDFLGEKLRIGHTYLVNVDETGAAQYIGSESSTVLANALTGFNVVWVDTAIELAQENDLTDFVNQTGPRLEVNLSQALGGQTAAEREAMWSKMGDGVATVGGHPYGFVLGDINSNGVVTTALASGGLKVELNHPDLSFPGYGVDVTDAPIKTTLSISNGTITSPFVSPIDARRDELSPAPTSGGNDMNNLMPGDQIEPKDRLNRDLLGGPEDLQDLDIWLESQVRALLRSQGAVQKVSAEDADATPYRQIAAAVASSVADVMFYPEARKRAAKKLARSGSGAIGHELEPQSPTDAQPSIEAMDWDYIATEVDALAKRIEADLTPPPPGVPDPLMPHSIRISAESLFRETGPTGLI